mmetsp:Transcript_9446/g.15799  ORF Transcript_9446/g.15799 Transcript_9446/m.15799 type:complete len:86 (+) Transcript_9446:25-282(+)
MKVCKITFKGRVFGVLGVVERRPIAICSNFSSAVEEYGCMLFSTQCWTRMATAIATEHNPPNGRSNRRIKENSQTLCALLKQQKN